MDCQRIASVTFGLLIVARWLGWSAPGISEAEALKLWNIVEIGLGGYVIGRSAEKTLRDCSTNSSAWTCSCVARYQQYCLCAGFGCKVIFLEAHIIAHAFAGVRHAVI